MKNQEKFIEYYKMRKKREKELKIMKRGIAYHKCEKKFIKC